MPSEIFPSRVGTILVPEASANADPATIIATANRQQVVKVRNVSFGPAVLIAFDIQPLVGVPSFGGIYVLPAGATETFVVAKGQGVYAATTGVGASISFHVYESFLVDDRD